MANHQQRSKTNKRYRDHTSTPQWLYAALNERHDFDIDLAATDKSAKHTQYFTKRQNALKKAWHQYGDAGWLNPPYSHILPWVERALSEQQKGFTTVFLVPMDASTEWWPGNQSCIIEEITGYYTDFTYKSGKQKGQTIKKWCSGRIEFVDARTGKVMKDPLNKPCCLITFPAHYQGDTIRTSVSKFELMLQGEIALNKQHSKRAA